MPNQQTMTRCSDILYWRIVLATLPFIYLLALVLPSPFGFGLKLENDFVYHRIWYSQVDTYFISKGYFPLWNPTYEMGAPHLASAFGTGALYPIRWLSYPFTYLGGPLNYIVQYVLIAGHMSFAMLGLFAALRRHGGASCAAAAFGAVLLLLNQCFNNFMRFPYGVENLTWVPWMLYFGLNLARHAVEPDQSARRTALKDFIALALCVTLGWLTGYGQFSYIGGLFVGLVVIFAARSVRGVACVALGGMLGSLLAIGSIWPAVEWVLGHPLRDGANINNINVVGVTDYIGIFLRPFAMDVHYSVFTHPVLLLVSLVGIAIAWRRPAARISLGMFVALILLVDVSRGLDGLTFELFYDHLPFFGAFNSPSKNSWLAFVPLAWFAALGADVVMSQPRARKPILVAIALLSVSLAWQYAPGLRPDSVGIWQPLKSGWIQPEQSVRAFLWLAIGGGMATGCFLAVRWRSVQAVGLVGLCILFSAFYARFNTFFSTEYVPQALIGTRDAFPGGLLGHRSASQGYLGLTGIGVTSPNVDPVVYGLMMDHAEQLLGDETRRFPASRFQWRPRSGASAAKLKLTGFGPNHVYFDVHAQSAGELTYLAKYSPHWRCNRPLTRGSQYDEFNALQMAEGDTTVHVEFVPVGHLATCVVTFLGALLAAGVLARLNGKRRVALACFTASVVLPGLMLAGSLTRHSMSGRDLFGVDNVALDPNLEIPPAREPGGMRHGIETGRRTSLPVAPEPRPRSAHNP